MTGPLLVLGVLSIAGGWLNLPEFAHGIGPVGLLHHWLEPVTAGGARVGELQGTAAVLPHGATEWALIAAAILIAIVGLALGWRTTLRVEPAPAAQAPEERGFWRVLHHKYYVDELYDRGIVQPLVRFSSTTLWKGVDQGVIDGAGVNGAAGLARALGWLGGRLQTGQVGAYVMIFVVGVLVVLGLVAWR
jgi:NADH-quinone oxidoreductase subunit L